MFDSESVDPVSLSANTSQGGISDVLLGEEQGVRKCELEMGDWGGTGLVLGSEEVGGTEGTALARGEAGLMERPVGALLPKMLWGKSPVGSRLILLSLEGPMYV
jgi:hypothetical protein